MKYNFDEVIPRKGTACFKYDALKMIYGRDDLLPLWVADMDFAVAPQIQEALRRRWEHPIHGYNLHSDNYYQAITSWTARRYDWETRREWIINTPGVVPALNMAILALTKPNDKILIQTPVYAPFHSSVLEQGRGLLTSPMIPAKEEWEIDFDDFEQKASQAKMFILCNPHNPVGRVFREEELLRMGEICLRHGVTIFSDEIHADIVYHGYRHTPIASLGDLGRITITSFSPAKSFNLAGLSTALAVCSDPELFRALNDLNNKLYLYMGNSFGISALTAAYNDSEDWLETLVAYLQGNRDYIHEYIKVNLPGLKTWEPQGTYLTWVDFSGLGVSEETLQNQLLNDAKLALDHGSKFGEDYTLYRRINYGAPRSVIIDAMQRISMITDKIQ
ncbi:MAG TPA: PatB family C-S lyase [Candidatus Cloacimonadota bacterium]|nr:PatB family C-S lyase [Candidatus Cloacimonadota bacterium]